jgi:hypothetical protein
VDGRRKRAAAAKRAVAKRAAAAKCAAAKRAPKRARKVGGARKAKAKPQRSRDGLPARAAAAPAVRKDAPSPDARPGQTFSDDEEVQAGLPDVPVPGPREARLQAVFANLPIGEQDALLAHVDSLRSD